MTERKHFPTFVLTFFLKGGLYQRMFLGRFFREYCISLRGSLRASWYTVLALSKQCRSDDISESRLLMESGMFFRIDGG